GAGHELELVGRADRDVHVVAGLGRAGSEGPDGARRQRGPPAVRGDPDLEALRPLGGRRLLGLLRPGRAAGAAGAPAAPGPPGRAPPPGLRTSPGRAAPRAAGPPVRCLPPPPRRPAPTRRPRCPRTKQPHRPRGGPKLPRGSSCSGTGGTILSSCRSPRCAS